MLSLVVFGGAVVALWVDDKDQSGHVWVEVDPRLGQCSGMT
jgi:hypothetical protein